MDPDREPKLQLADPGRDAAGDEIERILEAAEQIEGGAAEDAGFDSFLERFPAVAPARDERR
ncbi:hypothetical protein IHQ68_17865 [Chelatococcus sambhunathii]|uniref:Uncharacterized protein n=1 Tax=Chelatococcus sambhunathii TaxID=363953 RepID=A0ABU1DK33_9HYPH|nr:hypothetical protein [Chelatococcus sambhunathii]MDR4308490.1 hypothetical protein [Chelatococcus sambhunathii]